MAITKAKARSVKNAVLAGDEQSTGVLDATTTVSVIELTGPAQRVSIQTTGTLAGTAEYSINGVDFFSSTALVANTPLTYTTHNVSVVRITRTSGTGRAAVISV